MSELQESIIRSQMFLMIERNRGKKISIVNKIYRRALKCLRNSN